MRLGLVSIDNHRVPMTGSNCSRRLVLQVQAIDVVDSRLFVGRILGDDVPQMDQPGEVAETKENDIDEGVLRTEPSANPHWKWGKEHQQAHEEDVTDTPGGTHGIIGN